MNVKDLAVDLIARNLVSREMPPSGAKDFWLICKSHGLVVDELLEWMSDAPWPLSLQDVPYAKR